MTMRTPVCDGHGEPIGAGASWTTVSTPGRPDRHLCADCAALVWKYMPALIAHRALHQQANARRQAPVSVRDRALSMDLPLLRRK